MPTKILETFTGTQKESSHFPKLAGWLLFFTKITDNDNEEVTPHPYLTKEC